MKKVIEDCVSLINEDDKKKKEVHTENFDARNEAGKEKTGFIIKKNNKESEFKDPLMRKK